MKMREILFKAKRLDNGEWVEGSCVNVSNKHFYIFTGKLDISNGYLDFEKYSINPETLCQYTGLTDKNGNKIWENDIVEVKDFSCGIYLFREQPLKRIAIVWNKKEAKFERKDGISLFKASDFKVLVNIFDNPELMENE